jgi:hypothetical protein
MCSHPANNEMLATCAGVEPPAACCWLMLQGCFSVSAQMPVHYTVQEVHGIFNTRNKVGGAAAALLADILTARLSDVVLLCN